MAHTFSNRKELAMRYDVGTDQCLVYVNQPIPDETLLQIAARAHAINLGRFREAPYGSDRKDIALKTMKAIEGGRVAQVLPETGEVRLFTARAESNKLISLR